MSFKEFEEYLKNKEKNLKTSHDSFVDAYNKERLKGLIAGVILLFGLALFVGIDKFQAYFEQDVDNSSTTEQVAE